jgi:hypothetical protein
MTNIIKPVDENADKILKDYRSEISKQTGIHFPNFESYKFHISLAYLIEHLTPEEKHEVSIAMKKVDEILSKEFDIFSAESPELVFFNDMYKFTNERI